MMGEAGISTEQVETEWLMLRTQFYQEHNTSINTLTWPQVNAAHHAEYPNILRLVDLMLACPASSADAERGFSQLKLTKSSMRTHLTPDL